MSQEPIYKKVGKRYVQIGVYDDEQFYLPKGSHLTVVDNGFRSTHYNIDPDFAAIKAAVKLTKDEVVGILLEASEANPPSKELTGEQMIVWDAFKKAFNGLSYVSYPSLSEMADKIVENIVKKAEEKENVHTVRKQ